MLRPANLASLSDVEFHYDSDNSHNVKDLIRAIAQDLSSHRSLHDWDDKLVRDPVKDLATLANRILNPSLGVDLDSARFIFKHSTVEEVHTIDGINRRHYALLGTETERYLPSTKASSNVSWTCCDLISDWLYSRTQKRYFLQTMSVKPHRYMPSGVSCKC